MRVLEIAGSGTIGRDQMGPVSSVICNLSNCFYHLGHEVTIVDAGAEGDRPRISDGIRIINVACKPRTQTVSPSSNKYKRYLNQWLNEYRFVKDFLSKVDLPQFDVVHSHDCRATYILQKQWTGRLVYTSHTPTWSIGRKDNNLKARLRRTLKLAPRLERSVIRRSALTVALGDYLKKALPRANIRVIQNGIELTEWNAIDKKEARRALGYRDQDFILMFVGRINPIKGVDILLKAVRESLSTLQDLRVLIIGSLSGAFGSREFVTPYAESIINAARGLPVEIKGYISNRTPLFTRYLSASDVAVVPSLREPQGLVVLEALAMGKPVVASRVGGIPQMLNERIGCLFEPGNSADLAEKVRMLYENRDRLESMARRCRPFVEENFTWQAVAQRHIAAFEKVVLTQDDNSFAREMIK